MQAHQPYSTLLLFGATGDLAQRMLLPSIYGLDVDDLLPKHFRIVATACNELTDACYRKLFAKSLERFVPVQELNSSRIVNLLDRVCFVQADAHETLQFHALTDAVRPSGGKHAIFLSTAPSLFEPTISASRLQDLQTVDRELG